MKKVILALSLVFALCSAGAAEIKDSPDGFRGIKWGDPPAKLGAREKLGEVEVLSTYTRKGDKMSIGEARLNEIRYLFVQDRLFLGVVIEAKEKLNCDKLMDALTARYGKPVDDGAENALRWIDDALNISYMYDRSEETAIVHIHSKKMFDKFEAAEKQLAEAAKDD